MRAAILTDTRGIDSLTIDSLPDPEPGPGEVRVKIITAAINRRDVRIAQGLYPDMRVPCVLGSDGAGIVDRVGAGVDTVLANKAVVIYPAANWGDDPRTMAPDFKILGMPDPGTFAEYICVPAAAVVAKPTHLSWTEAAAVPLAGLTAWRAVVTQAEISRGQTVLITGAGSGVSGYAIQWAAALGARVYVTSGSDAKIAAARSIGAIDGVRYTDSDWPDRLRTIAGAFDVVIDSAGGDSMHACLDSLKPGGRLIFFGATLGNPTRGLDLRSVFWRQLRLQGTTMGTPTEFRAMLNFLTQHQIRPIIDSETSLDAIGDHIRRIFEFAHSGKIVIRIAPDPDRDH